MHVVYSKPCQISRMMRHVGNPQNNLFSHFQTYLRTFKNIQSCSGMLRDIKADLGIFKYI